MANEGTSTSLQDQEQIREGTWIKLGKDRYDRAEKRIKQKVETV